MINPEETSPEQKLPDREGCPYLGLRHDPQTRFGFPNLGNYCHRISPPELVTPEYQQIWCFSDQFPNCAVYQGASKDQLPDGLIRKQEGFVLNRTMLLAIGLAVVAMVLIISLVYLIGRNRTRSQQAQSQTATFIAANLASTPSATNTLPPPSQTPTLEPTTTPTLTNTPTVTPTSTPALPTLGPGLETPFGQKNEYLIHKVVTNESINIIALRYKTTAAVITAINELSGGSLQIDQILVIMPNQTEVIDSPVFHPVYIDQEASVDALVQEYGVSAPNLRRYNALGDGDVIPAGRWIIIPMPPKQGP